MSRRPVRAREAPAWEALPWGRLPPGGRILHQMDDPDVDDDRRHRPAPLAGPSGVLEGPPRLPEPLTDTSMMPSARHRGQFLSCGPRRSGCGEPCARHDRPIRTRSSSQWKIAPPPGRRGAVRRLRDKDAAAGTGSRTRVGPGRRQIGRKVRKADLAQGAGREPRHVSAEHEEPSKRQPSRSRRPERPAAEAEGLLRKLAGEEGFEPSVS